MRETDAIIERISAINSTHQHLELAVDESLKSIKVGQFLMVRVGARWDPFLRSVWYPVDIMRDGKLVIERPLTETYDVGQTVSAIGPAGDHFRFRKGIRHVLLIAYDCPPTPLIMVMPWLIRNNVAVTLVLIGSAVDYEIHHLPPEVEVIEGDDDLNWPDQVVTVGESDQVFVCAAPDDERYRFSRVMAKFRERRHQLPKNYLFGVFQGFACGLGMCDVCAVRSLEGLKLACMKGPAFDLSTLHLEVTPAPVAPDEGGGDAA